jgi:hypothetical protein
MFLRRTLKKTHTHTRVDSKERYEWHNVLRIWRETEEKGILVKVSSFSADKDTPIAFISPFLYRVTYWDFFYENIRV